MPVVTTHGPCSSISVVLDWELWVGLVLVTWVLALVFVLSVLVLVFVIVLWVLDTSLAMEPLTSMGQLF